MTDWAVFGIAAMMACGIVAWGVGWTASLTRVAAAVLQWLVNNLGWLFVIAATGFVVFALWAALSRYGKIPLGRDGEPPRVPHGVLDREDVQRGNGHRPDVLRGQ